MKKLLLLSSVIAMTASTPSFASAFNEDDNEYLYGFVFEKSASNIRDEQMMNDVEQSELLGALQHLSQSPKEELLSYDVFRHIEGVSILLNPNNTIESFTGKQEFIDTTNALIHRILDFRLFDSKKLSLKIYWLKNMSKSVYELDISARAFKELYLYYEETAAEKKVEGKSFTTETSWEARLFDPSPEAVNFVKDQLDKNPTLLNASVKTALRAFWSVEQSNSITGVDLIAAFQKIKTCKEIIKSLTGIEWFDDAWLNIEWVDGKWVDAT